MVGLDLFIQQNAIACAHLAEAGDRGSMSGLPEIGEQGAPACSWDDADPVYLTCMRECLLGGTNMDAVLVGLSDAYEAIRLLEAGMASAQDVRVLLSS